MSRALEKIAAAAPDVVVRQAASVARHVSAGGSTVDFREHAATVDAVIAGIERQETLRLTYRRPGQRGYTARLVDPYHLHIHAGGLYLLGYCHKRKAPRTFALVRTEKAELTGARFERGADIRPAEYFHGGFGPWSGKPVRVRLRFAPEVAAHVTSRAMHASQVNQQRSDGRLDVTLEVPLSPPVVAWVVGFGGNVEVVGPSALRDAVKEAHAKAMRSLDDRA
jgi:predicted DNA-binding transcriptional regulator YafY